MVPNMRRGLEIRQRDLNGETITTLKTKRQLLTGYGLGSKCLVMLTRVENVGGWELHVRMECMNLYGRTQR